MDSRAVANVMVQRPIYDLIDTPASDFVVAGQFSYTECKSETVDQSGAIGRGALHQVALFRSSLSKTRLAGLELMDVTIEDVSLANSSLSHVVFSECHFTTAELQARRAQRCDLTSSYLDGACRVSTMAGALITPNKQ